MSCIQKYPQRGGLDCVKNYRHYRLIAYFAGLLLYLGYSGRNVIVNVAKFIRIWQKGLLVVMVVILYAKKSARSSKTGNSNFCETERAGQKMKRWVMDKMEGVCCALLKSALGGGVPSSARSTGGFCWGVVFGSDTGRASGASRAGHSGRAGRAGRAGHSGRARSSCSVVRGARGSSARGRRSEGTSEPQSGSAARFPFSQFSSSLGCSARLVR